MRSLASVRVREGSIGVPFRAADQSKIDGFKVDRCVECPLGCQCALSSLAIGFMSVGI